MFPSKNFINAKSPLEKNDHPDLDNSELCHEEQITNYMSMIGQVQWAITLGRYDILAQVMSMSRFRVAPKIGHLERMKRLYVLENLYSRLGLTSFCADQFSSCALFKSEIACLHVSFTAYEYFYKLSKSATFSRWLLHPVIPKNQ